MVKNDIDSKAQQPTGKPTERGRTNFDSKPYFQLEAQDFIEPAHQRTDT